jgi:hypothetical protein
MVGGWVIDISRCLREVGEPKRVVECVRLWCVDRQGDECMVYGICDDINGMPHINDEIWWQSGRIYFDKDRRSLVKVGNSHAPATGR